MTKVVFQRMWGVQILPLVGILLFIFSTIVLFIVGPIPWPSRGEPVLRLFLAGAVSALVVGYGIGVQGEPNAGLIRFWRWLILIGGLLNFTLLFPSAYYYAGKMPWEIFDALRDQSGVYLQLSERLRETTGQRTIISLIRTITYPVVFAILPLGIIKWREMTWWLWMAWVLALMSSVMFSMLRGTDRELVDIAIVGFASILIAICRETILSSCTLGQLFLKRRVLVAVFAWTAVLVVVFSIFLERRVQRTEMHVRQVRDLVVLDRGWTSELCIRSSCPDRYHPFFRLLGPPGQYGLITLTGYLTQGYHGLSLALKNTEKVQSTYGIGHSLALIRLYERLTADTSLYEGGLTFKLNSLDWKDQALWSTIFPWLANDVGWPGAILVISFIALLWGRCWRDAAGADNDYAAIVFCFLFQLFVYLPANNQLAQNSDAYFAVLVWTALWLTQGARQIARPHRST